MNRIIYFLPAFILFSCGGSENTEDQDNADDTLYTVSHEWMASAAELKEKFGYYQAKFLEEIGNKEVEETICGDIAKIPYNGNQSEMNVWLMTTYMLDNFTTDNFGKSNFYMPDAKIKEETPLSALNWINMNAYDDQLFEIYRQYPDVDTIPMETEDGATNEIMVQSPDMMLKALKGGLFGIIAITDYLAPIVEDESTYETGYLMGYVMFAEWESGELSCITPFLAQNHEGESYAKIDEAALVEDLRIQTYAAIDSIARVRTGFEGLSYVNDKDNLERYRN